MLIGGVSLTLLLCHCVAHLSCTVVSSEDLFSWTMMLENLCQIPDEFFLPICACVCACVSALVCVVKLDIGNVW